MNATPKPDTPTPGTQADTLAMAGATQRNVLSEIPNDLPEYIHLGLGRWVSRDLIASAPRLRAERDALRAAARLAQRAFDELQHKSLDGSDLAMFVLAARDSLQNALAQSGGE